jgi:hypothetical protein
MLDIFVGQMFTEHSSFTFDYYMLNWCENKKGKGYDAAKYGTTLTGAPLHESPYHHKFGYDQNIMVCKKVLTQGEKEQFSFMIQQGFTYRLYLDHLPSATIMRDKDKKEKPADYQHGIPIGVFEGLGKIMIYNHLDITVITHNTLEGHHRIVGFEVEPYSIAEGVHRIANDPGSEPNNQYLKEGEEFTFSYRIITRADPKLTWASRMDHYMKFGNNNIHLANIIYSTMTISILFLIIAACLYRAIGNDFKAIEMIASKRRAKRDERRTRGVEPSEDEVGLTSQKPKITAEDVAWKKL